MVESGLRSKPHVMNDPTTTHAAWQNLLASAVVGTERHGVELAAVPGAVGAVLAQLDTTERERALLLAAGVFSWWQQAGYQAPVEQQPLPAPCSPEDQPHCSSGATQHLRLLMQSHQRSLLPEWLHTAADAGLIVPPICLPNLLALGANQRELRLLILPVLGQRGRWLAAQHEGWRYAAQRDDANVWDTGITRGTFMAARTTAGRRPRSCSRTADEHMAARTGPSTHRIFIHLCHGLEQGR